MTPTSVFEAPSEGGSQNRIDGLLKVTGRMTYAADIVVPGTLHAAALRSPYPHARIVSVDTSAAAALPGVHCVLTGEDVASIRTGRALRDTPLLAVGKTRFAGEMVAAAAAETPEIAEEAVSLIQVEYEPLEPVLDVEQALQPGAPAVHDEPWSYVGAARGPDDLPNVIARTSWSAGEDVEGALAGADRVFERTFRTQKVHQGYIEPHCCSVAFDGNQASVSVWSCNKAPYRMREQLAVTFDLPEDQIEASSAAIGGDFGGKGSPMDIPLCLALSRRTGRPVRMLRTYTEELLAGDPSPGSVIRVRMGVSHDGRIQALDVLALFNAGAYGGFTPGASVRGTSWTGYRLPVARVENVRVYTNEVPNGNMRAPAAPQNTFAMEAMMDFVAHGLGLDPFEFRRRNILRDGERTLMGNSWPESRGIHTLDLAERTAGPKPASSGNIRRGRGVALYDRPTHAPQRTSLRLALQPDGRLEAQVAIQETGTGSHTMLQRVLATALGLDRDQISLRYVGTPHLPWDEGVGGSRVTVSSAEAGVVAARAFLDAIRSRAAALWALPEHQVAVESGCKARAADGRELGLPELARGGEQLEVLGEVTGREGGHGDAATSFCVQVADVAVDVETGQVTLLRFVSANDVAEILDPLLHRGQIEGGIGMGIGFALSEDLNIVDGRVTASHLGEYKLRTMSDMPPLEVVLLPGGRGVGARNVKSIGEMGNVPAAAAVANAVSDAIGACVDSLPVTAEKVLTALRGQSS
ncbi:MAG TPA: xanthine dehydrogenase family protein molybdopterin-binding subunit [Chloroflexota bacterium]|nr:xanthine dehydrogenase family protein molybdopterin-binding subunit [Chloroflexota bacterium]